MIHRSSHYLTSAESDAVQVYYGVYFRWMEEALNGLLREAGHPLSTLLKEGLAIPTVGARMQFRRPLQLDDLVAIESSFHPGQAAGTGATTNSDASPESRLCFSTRHQFLGEDGEVVAAGALDHRVTPRDAFDTAMPVPDWLSGRFVNLAREDGAIPEAPKLPSRGEGLSRRRTRRITMADTDPQSVHAFQWFMMMEEGFADMMAEAGHPFWTLIHDEQQGHPAVYAELEVFSKVHLDDVLDVRSYVSGVGRSSFDAEGAFRRDGTLVARASCRRVWVAFREGVQQPIPVPDWVRAGIDPGTHL